MFLLPFCLLDCQQDEQDVLQREFLSAHGLIPLFHLITVIYNIQQSPLMQGFKALASSHCVCYFFFLQSFVETLKTLPQENHFLIR